MNPTFRFPKSALVLLAAIHLSGCTQSPTDEQAEKAVADGGRGEQEQVVAALQNRIRDDPDNTEARGKLCSILASGRRWDEAIPVCTDLLNLLPDEPQTLFNAGASLYFTGKPMEGVTRGRRAFEVDPDFETYVKRIVDAAPSPAEFDTRLYEFSRACLENTMQPRARLEVAGGTKEYMNLDCGISLTMPGSWRVMPSPKREECSVAEKSTYRVFVYIKRESLASISRKYPEMSEDLSRHFLSKQLIHGEAALMGQEILKSETIRIQGHEYESIVKDFTGESSPASSETTRVLRTAFWDDADNFSVTCAAPLGLFEEKEAAFRKIVESLESAGEKQETGSSPTD